METIGTSASTPTSTASVSTPQPQPGSASSSKELFAVISLLFFAPLIRKQVQEDDFGFSDSDKAYILSYTHKGMMILGYALTGVILLASSYLRREPLLHTLSTALFVIAALSILIGIIAVISGINQTPSIIGGPSAKAYSVTDMLSSYLPLITTWQRYAHPQEQRLITKEGRLLWTGRCRIAILLPAPWLLLSGLIVLMIRTATTLVSGYQYLPLLDKCMTKRDSQPEERVSYPFALVATSFGIRISVPKAISSTTASPIISTTPDTTSTPTGFFSRLAQSQEHLRQRYSALQPASAGSVIGMLLWIAVLAALGRRQLHTYTDTWRFRLAVLPYGIIIGRYFLIYLIAQRIPYIPFVQDIFGRFTVHAHTHDHHDQASSTVASTPKSA